MTENSEENTVDPKPIFSGVATETGSFSRDVSPKTKFWKNEKFVRKLVISVAFILSIIALIISVTGFYSARAHSGVKRSCKDIKGKSGLYFITPDNVYPSIQVYCDMEIDGGGWTLVAAVHENNIEGKCTVGDKWSSEQGRITINNGSKNWMNQNTFGEVYDVTNDDYKNSAYFLNPASNVMIWHVPNNQEYQNWSANSYLQYYTNNSFLEEFGNTLQSLYYNYAPLIYAGDFRYYNIIAPPFTYARGSNQQILKGTPLAERDHVTPGYIQFRAFDIKGKAYALCPGVRILQGDASRVCVGGGSERSRFIDITKCGDFAGWNGNPSTKHLNAKSKKDINSSILIFTR